METKEGKSNISAANEKNNVPLAYLITYDENKSRSSCQTIDKLKPLIEQVNSFSQTCTVESFIPDENRPKSVYWLQKTKEPKSIVDTLNDSYSISYPAHCYVEWHTGSDVDAFAFGGFQLISNAKVVETYYETTPGTDASKDEIYLTKNRGVSYKPPMNRAPSFFSSDQSVNLYQATCVVPGGPRAVIRIHLKFMEIDPIDTHDSRHENATILVSLRLTARKVPSKVQGTLLSRPNELTPDQVLPKYNSNDANAYMNRDEFAPFSSSSMLVHSSSLVDVPLPADVPNIVSQLPSTMSSQSPSPITPLTMDDIGAAMAGVSFMIRSTEERMMSTIESKVLNVMQEKRNDDESRRRQIQYLTAAVMQQNELLQQQSKMLQSQQSQLLKQQEELQTIARLLSTTIALQRDEQHKPTTTESASEIFVDPSLDTNLIATNNVDEVCIAETGET
jgi:hypothetical protein